MRFYKTFLFLFLSVSFMWDASAQEKNYPELRPDWDFTLYLIGGKQYDDALTLISREEPYHIENPLVFDSLNFLKGWTYYHAMDLEKASSFLDSVSVYSPLYNKSLFFSVISKAHLKQYDKAMQSLDHFSDTLGILKELCFFEKAGLSLLQRDLKSYAEYSKQFTYSHFALVEQQKNLDIIYKDLKKGKKKSPWIAGIASAVVPGLGKVYTGNIGEGISSFLTVGSLGAITVENWIKSGTLNWKTLVFGSIGAFFYIGNIYGSVASVKVYYEEFNHKQNITILYCIHIPLRTLFN